MSDRDMAEAIASAFQPGLGDAILTAEAEERARLQAALVGVDGDALIERARHRYIESPRSGGNAYRDILEELVQAALRGDSRTDSRTNRPSEEPNRAQEG